MSLTLQGLTVAIALAVFLGAVVVFLRGSKDKGTIETLQRNNEALTERVAILEAEGARDGERIHALENANHVLQNIANSSEQISAMNIAFTQLLSEHHEVAIGRIDKIQQELHDLVVALTEAADATADAAARVAAPKPRRADS